MTKNSYRSFCAGMLLLLIVSSFTPFAPPPAHRAIPSGSHSTENHPLADAAAWEAILVTARGTLGWEDSGFTTGGGGNIYITHTAVFGGQCSADPFIDENSEYSFLDIGGSWPEPGGDDTSEDFSFHALPAVRINRTNTRGNLTQQTIAWRMGDTVFKAYMKISCPEDGGRVDAMPYAEALYAAASSGADPCANVACGPDYCSEDGGMHYYDCSCDPDDGQCYCYSESCPAGCDTSQGACFPYEEPTAEPSPTPLASDLEIEDVILQQAIPGGFLVADKQTALRVFLDSGLDDQNQEVIVSLFVDGNLFEEQRYLLKPKSYYQDLTNKYVVEFELKNVRNTANFHLPVSLASADSSHTFSVKARWADETLIDMDKTNNFLTIPNPKFTNTRTINIMYESWANDIPVEIMSNFVHESRDSVLNMMPVKNIPHVVLIPFDFEYVDQIGLGLPYVSDHFAFLKLHDLTWKRRIHNARVSMGLQSGRHIDYAVGIFHQYQQEGGTVMGSSVIGTLLFPIIHRAAWVAVETPDVLVHEMGHLLFDDEYSSTSKGKPLPEDSVIYYGLQKNLQGIVDLQRTSGRLVNIMGSQHIWPFATTWNAFVEYFAIPASVTGRVTTGPALASPRMQEGALGEGYLLSGSISPSGTVEDIHGMWLQNQDADAPKEGDSSYWLEALSADGDQLGVIPVYPDAISEAGAPFLAFLPARQAETSEVRLVQEGQVVWSIRPSPSTPVISVHAVGEPGKMLEEVQPVSWQASDADGGALQYHVLFSHDGGQTWLPLTVNRMDPAYDLDPNALPGCEGCLLKVIASDGWHSTEADAPGTFTIPDKAPYVSVASPEDMSEFEAGEAIMLSGSVYDMEDGLLADDRVAWESDVDGPLGSGAYLTVDSLSEGTHTITLSASDSRGQQGQASIQVIVGKAPGGEGGDGMGGFYAILAVFAVLMIGGAAAMLIIMKRKGNKTAVIIAGVLLGISVLCLLASILLMFAGSPSDDGDLDGGLAYTPDDEDFSWEPSAWPTAIILPTQTAPAVPPPAATPGAETGSGTMAFRDDFTAARGWPDISEARADAGLSEGGIYTVSFWSAGDTEPLILEQPEPLGYPPQDMVVRVNATGMNEAGAYGLVCRVSGSDLYGFHVANDGRYWVYKSVGGRVSTLDSGSNPAITSGTNALEMRCIGDQIISSVNGVQVSQVSDTDLAAGNAGLFAQPLGGELVGPWSFYAQFDDFAAEFTYKEGAG